MTESKRSFPDRVDLALARFLFRLPPRVQLILAGGQPLTIDGQTLHPEIQLMMAARKLRGGTTLRASTPDLARKALRRESVRYSGGAPVVGRVRDLSIPGPAGSIPARHYAPVDGGAHPLLVFLHGGGFVTGDLDSHDDPCRRLCHHGNVHVLAVDYRLAPEHPFPAAVEDATAAFAYARDHARELGADPSRVGIGGDSAGANLSAVVAQLARRDGVKGPSFQLLVYPPTDRSKPYPSQRFFAKGLMLEDQDIAWFDAHYIGTSLETQRDVRRSPLLSSDFSGLCPALVVTAAFDPLRDEGEAYARALEAAGVETTLVRMAGMVHGFLNMASVSPAAEAAVTDVGRRLHDLARN